MLMAMSLEECAARRLERNRRSIEHQRERRREQELVCTGVVTLVSVTTLSYFADFKKPVR